MKRILLAPLVLCSLAGSAQSQRLSLYEEFTGETCPPCAAANPALNALLLSATNANKIIAIKWQVPIPSAPSATWSLYQTNKAEIEWRHKGHNGAYNSTQIDPPSPQGYGYPSIGSSNITSGVNSAPSGRIDGQHCSTFGAASDHPNSMNNGVINTAYSTPAAFDITMVRDWDATYSAVNLTVNIVATANFTATSANALKFRTVMVERNISFSVQPGTNGEKHFEDVAIKSFPDIQNGTPLTDAWITGQTYSFTLNCPIPSYCRDKSEIAMVGFIQDDGDRKVAQAARANNVQLQNDAKAMTATTDAFVCTNSITPTINVMNKGGNAITAMTITPYIDAVAQPDFYWTGNLNPGANTNITLNPLTGISSGSHKFWYQIIEVSGGDVNLNNNHAESKFNIITSYQSAPVVEGFVPATFPPTNWMLVSSEATSWHRVTGAGTLMIGGFAQSNDATRLYLYGAPNGSTHDLILPPMNFTSSPIMSFDVAYVQYTTQNDKLEVMYSTDCGMTWNTVFSKAGAVLATAPPETVPFVPSMASEWRKEVVTFPPLSGDVVVKFKATSNYGNNIFLDNINLQSCLSQSLTITPAGDRTEICKGEKIVLTAGGGTTYKWSNNTVANTITVNPTSTTTYSLLSTDPTGCGDSQELELKVAACTGVQEVAERTHQLFPNPSTGEFVVRSEFKANALFTVYNVTGQKVYESAVAPGDVSVKCELAAGVYQYQLSGDGKTESGKLIIK